jgi:hypothetical protein
MALHERNEWRPTQTARYLPMDPILTSNALQATGHSLPAIPEEDWDFGWAEDLFSDSGPYTHIETSSHPVDEPEPSATHPHKVFEDLINIQEQVHKLRQDISELQGICFQRLDCLEKVVTTVQRYVNNMIPWSVEVHEKFSQLLEVAKRREEGIADNATASAKLT